MINLKCNPSDLNTLFIDSSIINNSNGSEFVEKKYTDHKHKATKLSFIVSRTGVPISIDCFSCNFHDVHTIVPGLSKINKHLKKKLVGDMIENIPYFQCGYNTLDITH